MLGCTDKNMNIIQVNLQRNQFATQELIIEADKRGAVMALTQEPYVGSVGSLKRYGGTRVVQAMGGGRTIKSAIIIFDERLEMTVDSTLLTPNIVYIITTLGNKKVAFFSVYFEGSEPIEPYLRTLRNMCGAIKADQYLIGGDVNAWSPWWGSRDENVRGDFIWIFRGDEFTDSEQGRGPNFLYHKRKPGVLK